MNLTLEPLNVPPNTIIIGENIVVSEPFTLAFGGFGTCPVYKAYMTPEEFQVIHNVLMRAVPVANVKKETETMDGEE